MAEISGHYKPLFEEDEPAKNKIKGISWSYISTCMHIARHYQHAKHVQIVEKNVTGYQSL
jgi:hypothetical protein